MFRTLCRLLSKTADATEVSELATKTFKILQPGNEKLDTYSEHFLDMVKEPQDKISQVNLQEACFGLLAIFRELNPGMF